MVEIVELKLFKVVNVLLHEANGVSVSKAKWLLIVKALLYHESDCNALASGPVDWFCLCV